MLIFEKDDKKIIKHLRKKGLYRRLVNADIPADVLRPILVFKTTFDYYVLFCGHPDPKDNGWLWIHLDQPTHQERQKAEQMLLRLADRAYGAEFVQLPAARNHKGHYEHKRLS